MPAPTREQLDVLLDLIHHVRPTLDDDYEVTYEPTADEEGFRVFVSNEDLDDPDDPAEHILDLYYVRKDDIGNLVKAVRPLSSESVQTLYFYAHGHILGALLAAG